MENNVKNIQEKRNKLYYDFFNNVLPERMPVNLSVPTRLLAEYANLDVVDTQFKFDDLEPVAFEIAGKMQTDKCPIKGVSMTSRTPSRYQMLDSKSYVMGQGGFIQHPEVSAMNDDEYDELINDPYTFLLDKVLPRQYGGLNFEEPMSVVNHLMMANAAFNQEVAESAKLPAKLTAHFGYANGTPRGCSGVTDAPYDFISDQLRGFSNISKDIRRNRNKIYDACDAVMPLMFNCGLPNNPDPQGCVNTPLHMPTFMREKDFAEVWFPSYKTMFEQYASIGVRGGAFCEDNWTRYVDYLDELPAGTMFQFEYGDAKLIKDTLGKKYILQGLYPVTLLKTGTKQQVLDKAKELLDIMLPGGGYLFALDKGILTLNDINLDNYYALTEFVTEYAVYSNAGESFGMKTNAEGYKFDKNLVTPIKSKYMFDWNEFKNKYPLTPSYMKEKYENMDRDILKMLLGLLF